MFCIPSNDGFCCKWVLVWWCNVPALVLVWWSCLLSGVEPLLTYSLIEISLQPSLTWGHLWWCHGNMLHKFAAQWDQMGLIDSCPLSASFLQASLRWAAGTPCPSITWQMLQRQRLLICCWTFTTWSRYASSYRGTRPQSTLNPFPTIDENVRNL